MVSEFDFSVIRRGSGSHEQSERLPYFFPSLRTHLSSSDSSEILQKPPFPFATLRFGILALHLRCEEPLEAENEPGDMSRDCKDQ